MVVSYLSASRSISAVEATTEGSIVRVVQSCL